MPNDGEAHMPRTILDVQPGEHLCWLYATEQERWLTLIPFLEHGLRRGEKTLCFMEPANLTLPARYLRDVGIDAEPYLASGQLAIVSTDETYLRGRRFSPDAMLNLIETETARALADGYPALRATGEMSWALRRAPGSDRLGEYEAKVNEVTARHRCIGLCQYDRARFEPDVLLGILTAHPTVILGTELCENVFHRTSEESGGRGLPSQTLERRLEILARWKRTETALSRLEQGAREEAERCTAELRNDREKLRESNDALEERNKALLARAARILELKREVNTLCEQHGLPPRYEVAHDQEASDAPPIPPPQGA